MISTSSYNENFKNKLGKLDKKIKETQGMVMGGSRIISTILQEQDYEYSDWDLYVNYPLCTINSGSEIDSDFDRWIVKELGGVLILNANYQNKSCKYMCRDFVLNIISTECNTDLEIIEYINSTSDLDICTSTYDGYMCKFIPILLMKKTNIINKHLRETSFISGDFMLNEKSKTMFQRVFDKKRSTRQIKYELRGFEIIGNTLDEFDYQAAFSHISNQNRREDYIYEILDFIVSMINNYGSNFTLNNFLHGRSLFPFINETPIISIHSSLDFNSFSWAEYWLEEK